MAPLPDYLATLAGEDGASLLPDEISSGILTEYAADIAALNDSAAKDLDLRVKAAAWELLQTAPGGSSDDETPSDTSDSTASSDPDNSENDTDDEPDIDSFFGDPE